jgi:hypothetical protein
VTIIIVLAPFRIAALTAACGNTRRLLYYTGALFYIKHIYLRAGLWRGK